MYSIFINDEEVVVESNFEINEEEFCKFSMKIIFDSISNNK